MANKLTTNPWYVDTPGVLTTKAFKVHHFEFVRPAAAGDSAVLVNRVGNYAWTGVADIINELVKSQVVGWVDGLTLQSLTSGSVLIYFA